MGGPGQQTAERRLDDLEATDVGEVVADRLIGIGQAICRACGPALLKKGEGSAA